MQYFFKKNDSNNVINVNKYECFSVNSDLTISKADLSILSSLLSANHKAELFDSNFHYSAVFYQSRINSPWSSKAKDIIASCVSLDNFEIDRFFIYETKKRNFLIILV